MRILGLIMLNGRSLILLQYLETVCADGDFYVLEDSDLKEAFSPLDTQAEDLHALLLGLAKEGVIELKYSDRGSHCLRIPPEGREYVGKERERQRTEQNKRRRLFFASFLGAFSANILFLAAICLGWAFRG